MRLSILIPTVPSRKAKLAKLLDKLEKQVTDEVQIICLYDNKRWSLGAKRNKLIHLADSKYICFVDDDDDVTDDYVDKILLATEQDPDLITFNVRYTSDSGEDYLCSYSNGERPAHIHVWRKENIKDFPDKSAGEDTRWVKDNLQNITSVYTIDKVLYHYKFNSIETETQK